MPQRCPTGPIFVILALLAVGCGGDTGPVTPNPPPPLPPPPPPPPAVATVTVAPDSVTLVPGGTVQLTATARDAAGGTIAGLSVTWTSANDAAATVSSGGLVTAVAAGSAEIRAEIGGRTGSAQVSVLSLAAPSCTDCLEVAPGSVLLERQGAEQQLHAFRVDANGVRTPVTATWTSSHPEHVTVSAEGVARAVSGVGSSRITATAGGQTSEPTLALVAAPVPGALLVPDERVEGTITPVTPGAAYEPGWQYRVRLRSGPAPAVGQAVVGTGQQPIAGRVVSVTPAAGGAFDVVLEVATPNQLFTSFELKQTFALGEGIDVSAAPARSKRATPSSRRGAAGAGLRRAMPGPRAAARVEDTEVEFSLGPFDCTARAGVDFSGSLSLESFSFSVTPSLHADVDIGLSGINRILVTGSVAPQLMANPVASLALVGSLECEKALKEIPLPLTGPLSVLLGARVVVGVGFGLEAEVPFGGLGLDLFAGGTGQIRLGVDDCKVDCDWIGEVSGSADGFVKPVLPVQSWDEIGRVELGMRGYGWAELRIGGPIEETQANLLKARIGFLQRANLASELNQATDPGYASDFGFDFFADAKTGSTLTLIGKFLQTDLLEFSSETVTPLATSPSGNFVITPGTVVPGNEHELGEEATFTVALAPVTYLGFESVESVEIRWLRDEDGDMMLANGRPGCTSLPSTSPGQFSFSCTTDFLEEHEGTQTFHAFVKPKLFGVTLPVALEVGKATVEVRRVESVYAEANVHVRHNSNNSLCVDDQKGADSLPASLVAEAACPAQNASGRASVEGSILNGAMRVQVGTGAASGAYSGSANASVEFIDRVVIDAPGLTGAAGTFTVSMSLDGVIVFNNPGPCPTTGSGFFAGGTTWSIHGRVYSAPPFSEDNGEQLMFDPHAETGLRGGQADCRGLRGFPLPITRQSHVMAFTYGVPFWVSISMGTGITASITRNGVPISGNGDLRYRWLGMAGLAAGATVRSDSGIDWSKPAPP